MRSLGHGLSTDSLGNSIGLTKFSDGGGANSGVCGVYGELSSRSLAESRLRSRQYGESESDEPCERSLLNGECVRVSRLTNNCCASSRTSSIRMTDERWGFEPETGGREFDGRMYADLRCDRRSDCTSKVPSGGQAGGAGTQEEIWPVRVSCSGGGRRPVRGFRGRGLLSASVFDLDGSRASSETYDSPSQFQFKFPSRESDLLLNDRDPSSRTKGSSTHGGCEELDGGHEPSLSLSKSWIVSASSVEQRAWR